MTTYIGSLKHGTTNYKIYRNSQVDEERSFGIRYILDGTRKAKYAAIVTRDNPHKLFIVNMDEKKRGVPFQWITDKAGKIRVVK